MQVTITIETCANCRHLDHSGAFTPGGARQICGHSDASNTFGANEPDPYHWKHRALSESLAIPEQCPLKCGSKY